MMGAGVRTGRTINKIDSEGPCKSFPRMAIGDLQFLL